MLGFWIAELQEEKNLIDPKVPVISYAAVHLEFDNTGIMHSNISKLKDRALNSEPFKLLWFEETKKKKKKEDCYKQPIV